MNTRPNHEIAPAEQPSAPSAFALWNLGFRPFYLLASLFSVFSVLLWAAQFSGMIPGYLPGPLWHGHEMVFGYAMAVIAGFLLTAVPNWTKQPTPTGKPLMALALLWVGGRVLVLTPWSLAAMLINAAFPLAVAVAIATPLLRARNTRNYFFVGLLVLMSGLILVVHLALRGRLELSAVSGLQMALDIVLLIMAVIGGRVIPMFTNNGIPGANATRQPWVEKTAIGSLVLLLVADLLQLPPSVTAVLALVAALAHSWRLCLWQPWRTLTTPLVWVLHAAYAWIVVYLLLHGLTAWGILAGSFAVHALTVGAIGGLTLGMMTRTARGHTGRPLRADGFELTIFLLIQCAAMIRVFGGLVSPAWYMASIQFSGLLWAGAFGLYAVRYWPVLTRPRLDGKPG